MESKNLKSDN